MTRANGLTQGQAEHRGGGRGFLMIDLVMRSLHYCAVLSFGQGVTILRSVLLSCRDVYPQVLVHDAQTIEHGLPLSSMQGRPAQVI